MFHKINLHIQIVEELVNTFMYYEYKAFTPLNLYKKKLGDANAIHKNNSMLQDTINGITLSSIIHSLPMFINEELYDQIIQ
jgi:hypothetical protein